MNHQLGCINNTRAQKFQTVMNKQKEIKATKKAISARVNRAAWDWLEMNGINKNKLLDDLLTGFVHMLQHNQADYNLMLQAANDPDFYVDPITLIQQHAVKP